MLNKMLLSNFDIINSICENEVREYNEVIVDYVIPEINTFLHGKTTFSSLEHPSFIVTHHLGELHQELSKGSKSRSINVDNFVYLIKALNNELENMYCNILTL